MSSQITVVRDLLGTLGVQRRDQDGLPGGGGIWVRP